GAGGRGGRDRQGRSADRAHRAHSVQSAAPAGRRALNAAGCGGLRCAVARRPARWLRGANVRVLLDTHVLLWWLHDSSRLRRKTCELIASEATELLWSAASTWELAIKAQLGKVQ